ncbi:hypothetical protein HMPREF1219_01971 [Corynebacterium pyruviciproducens ATCC BAA-1742]|uniref:Uncharacterized protein n=1 Tax=Corynebacterium pyruviciproducens ATCC BAA-1742 TaxID=1125779 RepID=S2ZWA9_9CORY|nr:hypothetical protein HMPREF1219_01971 [Corynebacterium pyruviciproducens ATCC BAA-1742]
MQGIPGSPPITWRDFGLIPAGAEQSLDNQGENVGWGETAS